jgi:hypothetical protein
VPYRGVPEDTQKVNRKLSVSLTVSLYMTELIDNDLMTNWFGQYGEMLLGHQMSKRIYQKVHLMPKIFICK